LARTGLLEGVLNAQAVGGVLLGELLAEFAGGHVNLGGGVGKGDHCLVGEPVVDLLISN